MSSHPADRTMIRTSVGSLISRIGSWKRGIVALAFACALLTAPDARAGDATAARDRGSAAVEAVVDQFRRTGDIDSKLAELNSAAADLLVAAESFAKRGDYASAVQTLISLGDVHRIQGRWERALSAYRMAERFARQADDRMLTAKALKTQAQAESGQRLYDPAREHAEQAIRLSRGLADKKVLGDALLVLAEIQVKLADFAGAADSTNQAMTIANERGDDELRAYALLGRADIWSTMGRCDPDRVSDRCVQQLDLAVQDFRLARETAARLGWTGLVRTTDGLIRHTEFQAQSLRSTLAHQKSLNRVSSLFKPKSARNVVANESFAVSNPQVAALLRPMFEQAKRMEERSGYSNTIAARTDFTDGFLHQMEDDFDAALVSYRSALDLFELDRGKLQSDTDRGGFLANKLNFYYRPIEILLQRRNYAEAFDLFERSKSRAMADLLASRSISFPTEQERRAFASLMEQRTKVGGLQNDLFVLLQQNRPQQDIARASAEVAGAERQYQAMLEQMKPTGGKVHDLAISQPASLAQLQAAMRNESFEALMYHVDRDAIIVWHISADEVHVRSVFIPQNELVQKVRALYESVADRNVGFDAETARELYLSLVGPVRPWIKSRRLVVIPDGELYQVPFELLQNPEDGRFVGEEFQLSYAPSATILLGMKPPHGPKEGRLFAVADPELKAEAEAVAALYDGRVTLMAGPAPVTKKQVTSRIGDYDIVHLSVHGEFNGRQPLLSHLKLAPDDDNNGRLTAAEMFGLPLERADLVVLSACETGMASVGNGDELIGMTRALLFAGARSFVVSRWKVDVASTALWMKTFHAEAQTQPLAEAARRAVAAVRADPAFADPHHWAAFMLVGR